MHPQFEMAFSYSVIKFPHVHHLILFTFVHLIWCPEEKTKQIFKTAEFML